MPIPEDTPFPKVDFTFGIEPMRDIVRTPAFAQASKLFAADPYWRKSHITFSALSLLYAMVRSQHPDHASR